MIVHLPSLGLTEGQRQGLSKPDMRQNSQMARLCELADPLVDRLYVCPFTLPEVTPLAVPLVFLFSCSTASARSPCVLAEWNDSWTALSAFSTVACSCKVGETDTKERKEACPY